MNKKFVKPILAVVLVTLFTQMFMTGARAAPKLPDLTVSPYIQNIKANPGETTSLHFLLRNNTNKVMFIQLGYVDFTSSGHEDGVPRYFLNTDKTLTSIYPDTWFLQHDILTISPLTQYPVIVTIQIPVNATPGGHYGGVEFASAVSPTSPSSAAGVSVAEKIAVPVLFSINGTIQEAMRFPQMTISPVITNFFTSFNGSVSCFNGNDCSPVTSSLFSNEGTIHEAPAGTLTITNLFGGVVAKYAFNTTGNVVLPSSSRLYSKIVPLSSLGWLKIGYYTARLDIVYGKGNVPLSNEVGFWVIDDTVVLICVVVIILIVSIYVINKSSKGKIRNRVK